MQQACADKHDSAPLLHSQMHGNHCMPGVTCIEPCARGPIILMTSLLINIMSNVNTFVRKW